MPPICKFLRQETGTVLTEYMILLALLTSAVIVAVILYGTTSAELWIEWAEWIGILTPPPSST